MAVQQEFSSKGKKIELVIQQLNSLPTLPVIASRLLQITVNSKTQADEVVRLIESDPSLASRIITLATRADTGVRRNAASLSKAVVLLGFDAVRNAVLSIKVFDAFSRPGEDAALGDFNRNDFWKHCLAVACGAKLLSEHIDRKIDPEEAFVCGLLHDIGKLALEACLPRSFTRIVQITESSLANIAEIEKKVLGLDHSMVGHRLAQKWNLPSSIAETIWLHHQWAPGLSESVRHRSLIQTVHLADLMARHLRLGYSGNHDLSESPSELARQLKIPEQVMEKINRQLPQVISERAQLLGLDEIQPENLYYEALRQANSELGKLNSQLQQKNRKLTIRADYFQLLDRLSNELKQTLSVTDVCSCVARLWLEHTQSPCCSAYSITEGENMIEGSLIQQNENEPSVFLLDDMESLADQHDQTVRETGMTDFTITQIDASHQWFFEHVSTSFDIASTVHMPLSGSGRILGGIFWQCPSIAIYQEQFQEIKAFAMASSLAIQQAQKQDRQSQLCDQLAESNVLLQKTQQELLHKRNLASVGEMACGAAHEVNNPLAIAVGRAELLASAEEDPDKKKTLETIAGSAKQASAIMNELLEFAQPCQPSPKSCTPAEMVQQVVNDLQKNQQIDFSVPLNPDMETVWVDPQQIKMAIKEIVLNALESYGPEGGQVTIKISNDPFGDQAIVEICDHGCGMDSQTLAKAVDPFFSAKTAGRKRGLGLSKAHRAIEENRGHLHLSSQQGEGTSVRVLLPLQKVDE